MRPTIADVARVAQVSAMTVSRAIKGQAGVSDEVRRRVLEVVDELGYRPSRSAARLRTGQSLAIVGLLVHDIANPLFGEVARGIEDVADRRGFISMTASLESRPQREREIVSSLLDREVDGLLLFSLDRDHSYLAAEVDRGLPIVFLGAPPSGIDADAVLLDNRRGGRLAAEHLCGHGHRRLAVVGYGPGVYTTEERIAGFVSTIKRHGVTADAAMLHDDVHSIGEATDVTRRMLASAAPPTAIFTTNNRMTVGVLRAVHELGAPVEVISFDDMDLAEMITPPLTVIRGQHRLQGQRAAEMLFDRMTRPQAPPQRLVLDVELVDRGRTAPTA